MRVSLSYSFVSESAVREGFVKNNPSICAFIVNPARDFGPRCFAAMGKYKINIA